MTSKDFNAKYGVTEKFLEKIVLVKKTDNSLSSIAGRPKRQLVEIFKRFVKNPVVLISLIVFLLVIVLSLIIPLTSPYKEVTPVESGLQSDYFRDLPPSFQPIVTTTSNDFKTRYELYSNPNYQYHNFLKPFLERAKVERFDQLTPGRVISTFRYDAYEWFRLDSLNIAINAASRTQEITDQLVNQLAGNIKIPYTVLGSDQRGFDIWTNTWIGTWSSIRLALIVSLIATFIGVTIGAALGYHAGKWIDTVFMRLIDIFTSPPTLIWILILVSLFGYNDLALGIILVITGWPSAVGGTRLFMIIVKDNEFIIASKSIGASKLRLIYNHALPAIIGKISSQFVRSIPANILTVAGLAFLGFFTNDSSANLGQLLNTAANQIPASLTASYNFWPILLPALILLFLSISLHFIAVGIHDALDPKIIR